MQARLDKNFVYNCSLQLLEKKVSAADADRICNSSFKAEAEEKRAEKAVAEPAVVPVAVAPAASAVEAPKTITPTTNISNNSGKLVPSAAQPIEVKKAEDEVD